MFHNEAHPLAGKTATVDLGHGPEEYQVEDWWDRVSGGSWMNAAGNPAALRYAMRGAGKTPIDNEVIYGKVGSSGHLVHVSELMAD